MLNWMFQLQFRAVIVRKGHSFKSRYSFYLSSMTVSIQGRLDTEQSIQHRLKINELETAIMFTWPCFKLNH